MERRQRGNESRSSLDAAPGSRDRTAGDPLAGLHEQVGNRAMTQLLARAQPKLSVGGSRDPEEVEADRVAADVVARLGGGHDTAACAVDCEHQGSAPAVRRSIGAEGGELDADGEQAIARASRGGQPLPERTRGEMEQAFGTDFGGVKVHTDGTAAALAQSMSARAFTLGSHIFLGEGQRVTDRALMAHELTHTLQQDGRRPR